MSQSRWRQHAAPIITKVLRETAGQDDKAVRRALRDAYPFGPRDHHPYRIWCDEVQRQRGIKKTTAKGQPLRTPLPPDPRQQEMF